MGQVSSSPRATGKERDSLVGNRKLELSWLVFTRVCPPESRCGVRVRDELVLGPSSRDEAGLITNISWTPVDDFDKRQQWRSAETMVASER